MPRIGHIILNVSDFDVSEKFYDRILLAIGFEVEYREIGMEWSGKSYRFKEHNLWIKSDSTKARQSFNRYVGLDHLALFVDTPEQVDTLYEELKSAGCRITRAPSLYPEYSPEYYAFYFRDPDEIPLEIAFRD
jgi:catechol 2,3-dioxygenase-like lactoylglutathione lyase family enzyme